MFEQKYMLNLLNNKSWSIYSATEVKIKDFRVKTEVKRSRGSAQFIASSVTPQAKELRKVKELRAWNTCTGKTTTWKLIWLAAYFYFPPPKSLILCGYSKVWTGLHVLLVVGVMGVSQAAVSLLRNLLILWLEICSLHIFWRSGLGCGGFFVASQDTAAIPAAKACFLCRSAVHLLEELTF